MAETPRVPRPFSMPWGEGQVIEEARFQGTHICPAIQLMEYESGEGAGSWTLRFCYFNHRGQFQRSPLMLSDTELDRLREAIATTPRIQGLLRYIAGVDDRGGQIDR